MVEFVLGAAQLGLAYGRANVTGKPSHDAALALVRKSYDCGVTAFDTARAYGDSEERLGEALQGRATHIVTKLSPLRTLDADAPPDAVRDAVDESVATSMTALRQDRLETLLLHDARHLDGYGGAIWARLKEHQAASRILSLGISIGTPQEASRALADPAVRHIQLAANLLDWRWHEAGIAHAIAERDDIIVHIRSVFLQGILVADACVWPRVEGVNATALLQSMANMARELKRESVADLALAYIRAQDWADGAVLGMETEDQLQTNLRLFAKPPLTVDECAFVDHARPRVPAALLDPPEWRKT
jgi:aryl-alcohol dehydrogenase-like predicted oxidoreductase